jgi:hypothetical protein
LLTCWWSLGNHLGNARAVGVGVGEVRVLRSGRWYLLAFFGVYGERNNRCFDDLERSSEDILSSCFHTLYLWIVAYVCPVSINYDEFLMRFFPSS